MCMVRVERFYSESESLLLPLREESGGKEHFSVRETKKSLFIWGRGEEGEKRI